MNQIDFHLPARIVNGLDSCFKLGEFAASFGERAVLIVESTLVDNPQIQILHDSLKRHRINYIEFNDIASGSSQEVLHTILQKSRVSKPQVFITVGGIRTLAIGRLIASLSLSKTSIERFMAGESAGADPVPLIDIAATGRDSFSAASYIFLSERFAGKPIFIKQEVNPVRMVMFDPKIIQGIPAKQLAFLIFDHLLAAMENLTSELSNPISEVNAQAALAYGARALRMGLAQIKDIKTSIELCTGACLQLVAMANSGLGPGSAIIAAINSRFGIPKAWLSTVFLPHICELYTNQQAALLVPFAQALGEDTDSLSLDETGHRIAIVLRRFIAKHDLPVRLRDLKFDLDKLQEISDIAMDIPFVRQGPFPFTPANMMDLLRKAF